ESTTIAVTRLSLGGTADIRGPPRPRGLSRHAAAWSSGHREGRFLPGTGSYRGIAPDARSSFGRPTRLTQARTPTGPPRTLEQSASRPGGAVPVVYSSGTRVGVERVSVCLLKNSGLTTRL